MTDFATLAATQRRAYRTREAMLRQQHAQVSMSGKSRNSLIDARRSEGLLLDFVAAQCITAPRISGDFRFQSHLVERDCHRSFFRPQVIHKTANALQAKHRNVAVISLREYQLRENASGPFSQGPVNSPVRITLKNKGKIRPQLDRENGFAESSGGGDETGVEHSLTTNKRS